MRVVLDTNVLLSGVFTRGICEALLDLCFTEPDLEVVLSQHILDEFAEHSRKFGASQRDTKEAVGYFRRHAAIVEPAKLPKRACRDADDLPVLGTAVAAKADALVTGDADLLGLKRFEGIPILSPREFYDRFGRRPETD